MALGIFTKNFARSNDYSRGKELKQALEQNIEVISTADEFAVGSIIESLELLLTLKQSEFAKYQGIPGFREEG
jgi:DNA helicase-2/ATP-dependent DNA helicase PcrA